MHVGAGPPAPVEADNAADYSAWMRSLVRLDERKAGDN
jgi:hypothetical protein